MEEYKHTEGSIHKHVVSSRKWLPGWSTISIIVYNHIKKKIKLNLKKIRVYRCKRLSDGHYQVLTIKTFNVTQHWVKNTI